jgi:hypothetical protein
MDTKVEYTIFPALHEEANLPWVWLCSSELDSRQIVRVARTDPKRSITCQARIIDENFRAYYHRRTGNCIESADALVISDWYRRRLGDLKTGSRYRLAVRKDNWLLGRVRLYCFHPDRVVAMAFSLGVLSFLVSLASVVFALHSSVRQGRAGGGTESQQQTILRSTAQPLPPAELAKLRARCIIDLRRMEAGATYADCLLYNGSAHLVNEVTLKLPEHDVERLYRTPPLHAETYQTASFRILLDHDAFSDIADGYKSTEAFKALSPDQQECVKGHLLETIRALPPVRLSPQVVEASGSPRAPAGEGP